MGLLKGSLIGGAIGGLLAFALGIPLLSGWFAYLAVILTGVMVALLAGKPVWARGAWVEVLLKGIAAAMLGAGLLYAVRNYFDTTLALGSSLTGSLSQLPIVILPLVATVLAVFFEVDNTDAPEQNDSAQTDRVRVDDTPPNAIEADAEVEVEDEAKHQHVARR